MREADAAIAPFLRATTEASPNGEFLVVPQWQQADWEALFSYAQQVKVAGGDVLIHQDAAERGLYFVASGLLELDSVPGQSAIVTVHPGSVVGELSFLDGKPRATKVWAVAHSDLYRQSSRITTALWTRIRARPAISHSRSAASSRCVCDERYQTADSQYRK